VLRVALRYGHVEAGPNQGSQEGLDVKSVPRPSESKRLGLATKTINLQALKGVETREAAQSRAHIIALRPEKFLRARLPGAIPAVSFSIRQQGVGQTSPGQR
jgi:hypothetical protein